MTKFEKWAMVFGILVGVLMPLSMWRTVANLKLAAVIVTGYYSLAVGAVAHAQAPARMAKGLASHPVPVMLLARLAVDNDAKRKGLGAALLHDALARILQAADIAGIRAIIVHAKDAEARRFHEHFDFDPSPTDPYHLHLLIKELRKAGA